MSDFTPDNRGCPNWNSEVLKFNTMIKNPGFLGEHRGRPSTNSMNFHMEWNDSQSECVRVCWYAHYIMTSMKNNQVMLYYVGYRTNCDKFCPPNFLTNNWTVLCIQFIVYLTSASVNTNQTVWKVKQCIHYVLTI